MAVSISGDGAVTGVASINTDVSSTELGYLDGVTSSIQPQINTAGGLVLVGQSSFSAASSVSLDNVFSADYENYKIVTTVEASAGADVRFRLRASGVDDSTASAYIYQRLRSNSTNVLADGFTDTFWNIGVARIAGFRSGSSVDVFRPYVAGTTTYSGTGIDAHTVLLTLQYAGTHSQSTSYDGFTAYVISGTITGTIRVYGYAQ